MITEFVLGEYKIDNSQPKEIQHKSKFYGILVEGFLPKLISELIQDRDFELKLKVLKDEKWPSQGGFGLTDKYCVIAEVDE